MILTPWFITDSTVLVLIRIGISTSVFSECVRVTPVLSCLVIVMRVLSTVVTRMVPSLTFLGLTMSIRLLGSIRVTCASVRNGAVSVLAVMVMIVGGNLGLMVTSAVMG